ncbi:MAG: hypothetical protein JKY15_05565, partial [Deltaproteobacteria bacterium]|nr:hypothetical protein [Deltaproteobacteria bacterium]
GAISCGTDSGTKARDVAATTGGTTGTTTGTTPTTRTFSATTGADTITGTSGDDRVDMSFFLSGGTFVMTCNNGDTVDGLAGNDQITIQMNGNCTPSKILNVETVNIENTAASILTLSGADTGIQNINLTSASAAQTVASIPSAIPNESFSLANTGNNFTATFVDTALTGASDATTVKYDTVTAGTTTLQPTTAAGGGYETITVQSNGTSKNGVTTDLVLNDGVSTALTTVNFTGAQAMDMDITPTTVTTADASGMTGILDLQLAAANGQNVTLTGGSANDILNINGWTTNDTVDCGAGDADVFLATNAEVGGQTTVLATTTFQNCECLRLSDTTDGTTLTATNFNATCIHLGSGVDHTGNVVATFPAGTSTFDRQDSTDNANEATTLTCSGSASTDVLNFTLGTTAAGAAWGGTGATAINGCETVNILSQGGANTIGGALTVTPTAGSVRAVVLTGNQNITITGAVTSSTLDASGMSGSTTLTMAGGAAAVANAITGTANNDTIIGGTAADTLSGDGGNDTIRGAVSGADSPASDSMVGGAGFDIFQPIGTSASAATYSASAFISDFVVASTAAASDELSFDITAASYGITDFDQGGGAIAATAAGAATTLVHSTATNAASTGISAGSDIIKLTTKLTVAPATLQAGFNTAIGTAVITGITASAEHLVMHYDTVAGRALFSVVLATAGTNTQIETGDVVTLIASVAMTGTEYDSFNANHFSLADY